jgi:hypothetical protein
VRTLNRDLETGPGDVEVAARLEQERQADQVRGVDAPHTGRPPMRSLAMPSGHGQLTGRPELTRGRTSPQVTRPDAVPVPPPLTRNQGSESFRHQGRWCSTQGSSDHGLSSESVSS